MQRRYQTQVNHPVPQVFKVFAQLCPAMGLRLGLASGKLPLAVEADALTDSWQGAACSAVDVLVATPGRLMSHLQGTPGLTLDALQMLVSNASAQSVHSCLACAQLSGRLTVCM